MTTMQVQQTQRIQLRRTRGWRLPEGAVSVARPSRWGNPFRVDVFGLDLCLALYEQACRGGWNLSSVATLSDGWARVAYGLHRAFLARFPGELPVEVIRRELPGKSLACHCPLPSPGEPDRCHGAILLALANPPPA